MNNISFDMAKKEIQKVIVSELYKKDVIQFFQYNNIIKQLDEQIVKLKNKFIINEDMKNIIVKILI